MTWLAPALVALPLGAAAILIAVLDRIGRRGAEAVALAVGALALAGSLMILRHVATLGTAVTWFGGWHPGNVVGLGIAFGIDLAAAGMATLVATVVFAVIVFSREYFDDVGTIFYVLLLAMLGAMLAFAFAADAFDLFVFYEVFSVAAYALSAYRIEQESAFAGAFQFAVTNTVAGLFILFGIILLEGRTGELNLASIGHSLAAQHASDALVSTSFAFITIGLFTRGALAPLHFWFDEVHASAPSPLCAILSGAMAPLALYGFMRFYWSVYATALPPGHGMQIAIIAIGSVSALVGSVMCLREPHLKRALAFSTVAHAGVTVAALGAFRPDAIGAGAFYFLSYALGAAGLFMALAIVRAHADSVDRRRLVGCGRTLPLTAVVFALGTCDVAGVWFADRLLPAALLVVVSAATGGAFARAFWSIFIVRRNGAVAPRGVPWYMLVPAFVLVAVPIIIAAAPPLSRLVATAGYGVADHVAYGDAVLGGVHTLPPVHGFSVARGWFLGALIGILGVAWCALTPLRAVSRVRVNLLRNTALRRFASLHSGNAGDYVGWIVGTAGVTAILCGIGVAAL